MYLVQMVATVKPVSETTAPAPHPQAKRTMVKPASKVTSKPVPIKAKKGHKVSLSEEDSDYEP